MFVVFMRFWGYCMCCFCIFGAELYVMYIWGFMCLLSLCCTLLLRLYVFCYSEVLCKLWWRLLGFIMRDSAVMS